MQKCDHALTCCPHRESYRNYVNSVWLVVEPTQCWWAYLIHICSNFELKEFRVTQFIHKNPKYPLTCFCLSPPLYNLQRYETRDWCILEYGTDALRDFLRQIYLKTFNLEGCVFIGTLACIINKASVFDSSRQGEEYMQTRPSLVRIMTCLFFGAKPISNQTRVNCWLDPWEHMSVKFPSKRNHLHTAKCISKRCRLPNNKHCSRPQYVTLSRIT